MPTGDQRDRFKDAAMYGVQAAVEVMPTFHLLGTFSWVPGQTTYAASDDKVQILQYDVGAELGLDQALGSSWEFKPFVGAGAGARTYLYKSADLMDKTCNAGYGALGSELQYSRVAFRLEARENVYCFKSPVAGVKKQDPERREARVRPRVSLQLMLSPLAG